MRQNDVAGYDIFISYRRDGGSETAKHLRDVLTERGYRVFFDTDSLRSGNFNRKLFDVIDACKDVIVILSPGALDRCVNEGDWVRLEIARALELGKNVVPVMSGSFEFPETLPEDLDDLRWQNGVAVNIEFFDAMIDKLVSFLVSTPARRKNKMALALVAGVACAAVVGTLAFSALGSKGGDGSEQHASSSATASSSSTKNDSSSATQKKTYTESTLGSAVEVYGATSGQHEYDLSVDDVHMLPESMKYDMWETYDDEKTDLIGVQCSLDNHGYGHGSEGEVQPYQIAQDSTVMVKDADGYLLAYVTQMYHGSDGAYSCETTTAIPSGAKGRFCLIFYVEKGTSEVTLSIDNHNGQVFETPITLE